MRGWSGGDRSYDCGGCEKPRAPAAATRAEASHRFSVVEGQDVFCVVTHWVQENALFSDRSIASHHV